MRTLNRVLVFCLPKQVVSWSMLMVYVQCGLPQMIAQYEAVAEVHK